jgi:hypothetical protein
MAQMINKKNNLPGNTDQGCVFRYTAEDDDSYHVVREDGVAIEMPKNRNVHMPSSSNDSKNLTPAFRLLALAFLGLAPAGLGTLILAPLAALWTLGVWILHPMERSDIQRVLLVWALAVLLLLIATPMSKLILTRLY